MNQAVNETPISQDIQPTEMTNVEQCLFIKIDNNIPFIDTIPKSPDTEVSLLIMSGYDCS